MRGMGLILRHIHYMGRYIQFLATRSEVRTSLADSQPLSLMAMYVNAPAKSAHGDHDCDLKASQVILDGAHESVG